VNKRTQSSWTRRNSEQFLRDYAAFIHEPICEIFNAFIRDGRVPEAWKMANVLAVAKSIHHCQLMMISGQYLSHLEAANF